LYYAFLSRNWCLSTCFIERLSSPSSIYNVLNFLTEKTYVTGRFNTNLSLIDSFLTNWEFFSWEKHQDSWLLRSYKQILSYQFVYTILTKWKETLYNIKLLLYYEGDNKYFLLELCTIHMKIFCIFCLQKHTHTHTHTRARARKHIQTIPFQKGFGQFLIKTAF